MGDQREELYRKIDELVKKLPCDKRNEFASAMDSKEFFDKEFAYDVIDTELIESLDGRVIVKRTMTFEWESLSTPKLRQIVTILEGMRGCST